MSDFHRSFDRAWAKSSPAVSSTADHDHGPTAGLLDPVYRLTCCAEHVATIPAVTFRCDSCGFGSWGHSVAAAHADTCPEHVVFPLHHRTVCAAGLSEREAQR